MIVKSRAFVACAIILGMFVAFGIADDDGKTDDDSKTFSELYSVAAKKLQFKLLGHLEAVENARKYLKDSISADDQKAIKEAKKVLSDSRSKLLGFMAQPFDMLNVQASVTGNVVHLNNVSIKRELILNSDARTALCTLCFPSGFLSEAKIIGLTKEQLTGEQFFRTERDQWFVIVGTTTVNKVRVVDEKLVEFKCVEIKAIDNFATVFTPEQMRHLVAAQDVSGDEYLTDEQQEQSEKSRKFNAESAAKKDSETKLKTAKAYLATAKSLIEKQKTSEAKKWLSKAIAIRPDSESAKEAKTLLDGLK